MRAPDFSVPAAGGELAGWRTGSGEPALLLHGGPGVTDDLGALADELAGRFATVRYQQRGLAPSVAEGPYSVEQSVADALAVLDGLGLEQAWLVGHSWGGHLAMHVAVAAPERVLGLVAVDPLGALGDGGEADLERSLDERLPPEVAERVNEIDARLLRGEGEESEGDEMLELVWPYYFANPESAPPLPPFELNPDAYAQTWDSVRAHLERGTLERGLPGLRLPATFVLGAASPIPPEHGLASAALVPGARTVVVERAGHFPWLERPGSVLRAVDELDA